MAAKKYFSRYQGEQFDQAIEYILSLRENSTSKVIASSPDNKADLDTIFDEEGIYTIHYYIHSYDDTDESAIDLTVVFLDDNTVLQQYKANGTDVERSYNKTTGEWSTWSPVKPFLQLGQDEEVTVSKPTLILRKITNPDEFFAEPEEGDEEGNNGE